MKFELNGISTPVGGISWDNNTTAKDRFRYLLLFLESKRILTNPSYMELKAECVESVLEIKRVLTEITKDASLKDQDYAIVRSLVIACNEYLDSVRPGSVPHLVYKNGDRWADGTFDAGMKNFRTAFKSGISQIEKTYNLRYTGKIPDKY